MPPFISGTIPPLGPTSGIFYGRRGKKERQRLIQHSLMHIVVYDDITIHILFTFVTFHVYDGLSMTSVCA